jgi:uroporphyrinogen-III synthase
VTRPEPDADETAARLAAAGHEVLVQPMLRIVLAPQPDDLPVPAAIIATSRNGIRAMLAWPAAPGWRTQPIFVTGEGTAQMAREAGFGDIRVGGSDAVALADRISAELAPGAGPVLYAAGRDGTEGLAGNLRAGGYDLRLMHAYRAAPVAALDPDIAAVLGARRIDGVLLFSRRTAAAFVTAVEAAGLRAALTGTVCYAISERAAEPVRGVARDIRVAAHPDFDGIAAMIPAAGRAELA